MIIRQGVDSKALLVTLIRNLPRFLLLAAAGAVLGSVFHLIAVFYQSGRVLFVAETEYYVDFADGRLEAKDYYNDFTWNDVIATDWILGRMMEQLGESYDRAFVKQMITADILSDVRYLTITVKGRDKDAVADVSTAFESAITVFGADRDEFDAIYKIEDNGIVQEQPDWFDKRVALLGAVIFAGMGFFFVILAFLVGDRFYTKIDVMKFLGLPVVGMLYKSGNQQSGRQEHRLTDGIQELLKVHDKIYVLDAADGRDAALFVKRLAALDAGVDCDALLPCERYCTEEDAALLVVVPFGVVYREKITDEINNAVTHGGTIAGAVLTECDRRWCSMYYGRERT